MWFNVTYNESFKEDDYNKIWTTGSFLIPYIIDRTSNIKLSQKEKNSLLSKYEKFLDENIPFICNKTFYTYEDENKNIFFEYIEGSEIYNGNEEVNYVSLIELTDKKIQLILEKIIERLSKSDNYDYANILEIWLLEIKSLLLNQKKVDYINNTVMGCIDINWYEWQWKWNNSKYIKNKDLFLLIDQFSKDINKQNLSKYIKILILKELNTSININNIEEIYTQNKDNSIDIIINNKDFIKEFLSFLKKKKIFLDIEYEDINKIKDFSSLIQKIIDNSEYISGFVCDNCSAENNYIKIDNWEINFRCWGCEKINKRDLNKV